MQAKLRIGFLGAGKMATALAQGILRAGLAEAKDVFASDVAAGARESFARQTGGKVFDSNLELAKAAQILVLAVKPGQVSGVLRKLRDGFTPRHLLISIAAGVPLGHLLENLSPGARIVRVMPNTPALVGVSAAAYAVGEGATPADGELVEKLLSSVGLVYRVNESLLDAVTGLSGSGPAYVYQFIEALSDGGVAAGLPRDIATRLAAQTVLGAAKMVLETGLHPGALKDQVTSPGGTTIAGLHELEKGGLRGTVMNAVLAAAEKSRRLSPK